MKKATDYSCKVKQVDEGEFAATFEEFPTVIGAGDTPEEAVKEAYGNLDDYLDWAKDNGQTIVCPFEGHVITRNMTVREVLVIINAHAKYVVFDKCGTLHEASSDFEDWAKNADDKIEQPSYLDCAIKDITVKDNVIYIEIKGLGD